MHTATSLCSVPSLLRGYGMIKGRTGALKREEEGFLLGVHFSLAHPADVMTEPEVNQRSRVAV